MFLLCTSLYFLGKNSFKFLFYVSLFAGSWLIYLLQLCCCDGVFDVSDYASRAVVVMVVLTCKIALENSQKHR